MSEMKDNRVSDQQVDDILRSFFRSALPEAWPALKILPRHGSSWRRRVRPLALAASIAALFLGYLALAACFPRIAPTRSGSDAPVLYDGTIGSKERIQKTPAIVPEQFHR